MKPRARRGISPVIATVIIVAVAIAIAIAVAGWIMGLWGGFGKTESLKVFPDSYATVSGGYSVIYLHIQNVGGSTAQIYKVEVANVEFSPNAQIDPGEETTLTLNTTTTTLLVSPGVAYSVTIYTESGNVYTATVYGK